MVSKSGLERILAFHGPGAIVGELAIIDGLPRPMSAVAVRDTVLNFLSRTAFEHAFAKKHPELCQSLLRLLTKRMRERDKMLAATSFLKVKGRIAQTLLELAEHFGQEVGPGRCWTRVRGPHPQQLAASQAGGLILKGDNSQTGGGSATRA